MWHELWERAMYCWGKSRSWISEIQDSVAYIRASRCWQTAGAITITAMVEDGLRPDGKPRPPAGGADKILSMTGTNPTNCQISR